MWMRTTFAGDEVNPIHVYPLFGREHEMSDECWCHPEHDAERPEVIVHNEEN